MRLPSRRHVLTASLALAAPGVPSDTLVVESRTHAEERRVAAEITIIRTQGFARPGDGGEAAWTRTSIPPRHDGWFRTADGAIWRIAETDLRPEMFARVGASADADTAAWTVLASVADALAAESSATIKAAGAYSIHGPISFRGGRRYALDLEGAKLRQAGRLKPVLHFHTCGEVEISGGTFSGLGGAAGEYAGASSSHNGVAAVYCEHVEIIRVRGTHTDSFAGGAFFVLGGRVRDFEGVVCRGIGAAYIDPRRPNPNQANGGDAALHFVPATPFPGWIYEDRIVNCRLSDHAFGVRNVATCVFILRGNEIGPCPGQHGVYGTDLDGVIATDNVFRECRQAGFKNQLENLAGRFGGAPWVSSRRYAVGDHARMQDVLFSCVQPHVSAARFDEANWVVAARFQRGPGVFRRNRIERCGTGFHQVATPFVEGRRIFSRGWTLEGNQFMGCIETSIRGERLLSASIRNNTIEGSGFASMFLAGFGGRIEGNRMLSSQVSILLICAAEDVEITGNEMSDPGLSGTDDAERAVATFFPPDAATSVPGGPRNPVVTVADNTLRWTPGRAPRYVLFGYDRRLHLRVINTRATDSAMPSLRWDGQVLIDLNNRFSGIDRQR